MDSLGTLHAVCHAAEGACTPVCKQCAASQRQSKLPCSHAPPCRGVSADQDARYGNKMKKAMAQLKFPKELDEKVGREA